MNKTKRLLALLLALVMVATTMAACSKSEGGGQTTKPTEAPAQTQGGEETKAPETTAGDTTGEETQAPAGEQTWDGEVTDINVMLMDLRGVSENAQPVIDAMNEITEKSIGVRIHVTWAGTGDYATQLNLSISGNEQLDLAMIAPIEASSFTTLSSNGQLMDITEYMNNEGKDALALVKDYIGAYSIEGKIYGIPTYRNYGSSVYLIMRKDILEQVGMMEKAENLSSWSEVEEIFAAVAEQTELAPIAGAKNVSYQGGSLFGDNSFANTTSFDNLSDVLNVVFTDNEGNVTLLQENEAYRTQMDMVRSWYEKGWIYKDSLVTTDHVDTLLKAGVAFCAIETSELGVETSKLEATGYDMLCVELVPNMIGSSYVNKFGLCVPVTAQEPEAAVRWINALFTNPDLTNLLVWGREGEDYVMVNGEADYPEGKDASSVAYHTADFLYGNYFNAHPWAGNGADFREVALNALKSSPVSPYLGFAVDQSELTNTIAAITSVVDKYKGTIYCGAYTDAEYDEFVTSLKTAGVEEYLAAYQEQLKAWIEANK